MSEVRVTGATPGQGFADAFAAFDLRQQENAAPAWSRELRQRAFEAFSRTGLPNRKHEDWRYTSLRSIEGRNWRLPAGDGQVDESLLASVASTGEIRLVFVDGMLSTGLSVLGTLPAGVELLPVGEALGSESLGDKADWNVVDFTEPGSAGSAVSPFELLSQAFLGGSGLFLRLGAGVSVATPFHIVHVSTKSATQADRVVFPRHRVVLGEGASAHVIETYVGPDDVAYLNVPVTDVSLAKGATLTYARVQTEGNAALNIGATRAVVATDASFKTFAFGSGAKLSRFALDIELAGERAHATLDGLYLVRGEQHLDNHTTVDHQAPATTSDQVYKGILNDAARAVFNGKVLVRHGAPKTDARQLNKNLLLSSEAEIDTKPELQIDVDDVKCSHGAAVGRLDADEIFYLQSRGLDEQRAERLLMRAFAEDVIRRFEAPATGARLLALAEKALT